MKVKLILRHGNVLALTDNEAQDVEIEVVGCDDCSLQKWSDECDECGLDEARNFNIRVAKD